MGYYTRLSTLGNEFKSRMIRQELLIANVAYDLFFQDGAWLDNPSYWKNKAIEKLKKEGKLDKDYKCLTKRK